MMFYGSVKCGEESVGVYKIGRWSPPQLEKVGIHHFGHISRLVAPKIIKKIPAETSAHGPQLLYSKVVLNRRGSIFKKSYKIMCLVFLPLMLPRRVPFV